MERKLTSSLRSGDRKAYITLWRVAACLLILNSHCREIYPLSFLALGGGQGNGIFFVVSGYCLARIRQPFSQWYGRRAARILPAAVLCLAVSLALDPDARSSLLSPEGLRYCSSRYWFAWAILLYYVPFFFIFRKGLSAAKTSLAVYGALYLLLYLFTVVKTVFSVELEGFSPFKVYFYFGIFLLGGILRLTLEEKGRPTPSRNQIALYLSLMILSMLVWGVEYLLVMVLQRGYGLQLLIHVGVFVFSGSALMLGETLDPYIRMPKGRFGSLLGTIAQSTLEIYLVQIIINPCFEQMRFPVSLLLFFVVSLLLGIFLQLGLSFCINKIGKSGG